MTMPVAGLMQTLGDLLVLAIVLGTAAYGVSSGLFIATIVGMQALTAVMIALGFFQPCAALLISLDMPPVYAVPVAFGLLALGTAVILRLLIGRYVPSDAVSFEPLVDKVGGGLLGGIAGIIAAGGVLLALSILPLPATLRLAPDALRFDPGSGLLRTFARVAVPDKTQQQILLDGDLGGEDGNGWAVVTFDEATGVAQYPEKPVPPEPPADGSEPPIFDPPPPGIWSEPFADRNGNGTRDESEAFLDYVPDGTFTKAALTQPRLPPDHTYVGQSEAFFVGLRERYLNNQWERWTLTPVSWGDLYPEDLSDEADTDSAASEDAAEEPWQRSRRRLDRE